jgi:hypothetical protein
MKNILKSILLFLSLMTFSNTDAQHLYYLGFKYSDVVQLNTREVKAFDKLFNKDEDGNKKFIYKLDSGLAKSENLPMKKFLSFNYTLYKTPHINVTNYFYFDESNICDSIVIIENVCFDCGRFENEDFLSLFLFGFFKVSGNEYETRISSYVWLSEKEKIKFKKDKNKKLYIRLIADPLPITGECKKWTFTIKDGLNNPEFRFPKRTLLLN